MSEKRLGGRYEIQNRVGGGGMAVVYKGHDLLLDRTVAIKVLRSQFGNDEDFIKRFRREAQAAARLTHPNVVSIYDVGQEEDIHYIVMEYVEGENLKELIKRKAPIEVEKAVKITIQIADALSHAHQHEIIHRDIKPHNILIGKDGRIKVTDFGIARAVSSATITQTGSVLGSVHYFSPEQAKGGFTGEKSDIYSLGVVLYEMVTGYLPFSGESPISVALKHLQEDFKDPKEINPELPQSVENIILKSLNKDPDKRYNTAQEMVYDLRTCLNADRLHEEKYIPVVDDREDEPTIVIPVIKDTRVPLRTETQHLSNFEDEDDTSEEVIVAPQKPWIKPLIWVGVIAVFIGIGIFLINQLVASMRVPEVSVPFVEGKQIDIAVEQLMAKGLLVERDVRHDPRIPEGLVIRQDPKAGSTVKKNTYVSLIVSMGRDTVPVPSVTGLSQRDAENKFNGNGYKRIVIEHEFSKDVPPGNVIRQTPHADEKVIPEETEVVLVISKGQESFKMPSLIGKTKDEAKSILLKNNLILKEKDIKERPSYFDRGYVVDQWPIKPNELVSAGTEISIEISSGLKDDAIVVEEPILVPILEQDGKTDIIIQITDARYSDYTVINETISRSKEYPNIRLVLSPDHDGMITIFKNGVLYTTRSVPYAEVMGGDF